MDATPSSWASTSLGSFSIFAAPGTCNEGLKGDSNIPPTRRDIAQFSKRTREEGHPAYTPRVCTNQTEQFMVFQPITTGMCQREFQTGRLEDHPLILDMLHTYGTQRCIVQSRGLWCFGPRPERKGECTGQGARCVLSPAGQCHNQVLPKCRSGMRLKRASTS